MHDVKRSQTADEPWSRYGWLMAAVWLVFLLFPARAIVSAEKPPVLMVLAWGALLLFAAAYTAGFVLGMRCGWRNPSPIVFVMFFGAALSALATVPTIGWDATSFLPFLMAYASYCMGRVWHWGVIATSFAILAAEIWALTSKGESAPWALVAVMTIMSVVNTVNTWLIDRSVSADALRINLAKSEQRESISRDIHDLLGHSLTVIKLKSELAVRLIDQDRVKAKREVEEIARLSGEALGAVRSAVSEMRHTGFAQQVIASQTCLRTAGMNVAVSGDATALSQAQAIPAEWILREATTNVLRHSDARNVGIEIAPGTLIVTDDGRGTAHTEGNGLFGMQERAAAAGAALAVESQPGLGTKVSLQW
ncbi:sensor histidine kinase [Leucobacter sp. UCMA 4100]|uniref:sensor histidine kinase n=1 Tax=Leucobacter sp. UCMA 4100 TaxID=2810534 RepID=UPI0022EA4871|nr:histidine kinase [Leucobacter sp. UCMA 4100]MDA3146253.1 sensor histidine kinase [Leucobacter sp. UCMA 4100]